MKTLMVLLAGAGLLAAQQTTNPQIAFVATADLRFGTEDLAAGSFSQTGPDFLYTIGGIGLGADGKLYGLDASNSLVRIDPGSGVPSTIGFSGIPLLSYQPDLAAIVPFTATADGTLYGVSPDNALYKFNPATGAATRIGPTGVPTVNFNNVNAIPYGGMAAIGNTLYWTLDLYNIDQNFERTTDITPNALYTLNLATGAAAKVADLAPLTFVFSGVGGKLWAGVVNPDYSPAAIEILDPKNGAATVMVRNPAGIPYGAVTATPVIAQGGVINAASGIPGMAPAAWFSIYGADLATGTAAASAANLVNGSLPTSLGGTSVTIDGKPAFVDLASPAQLNVEAPADTTSGAVSVVVTNSTGSVTMNVSLQPVLPGVFTLDGNVLAVRPKDAVIIDGTGAAAKAGDVLEIFATGLGGTITPVAPGMVFSGSYPTAVTPTVTIGGAAAAVSYSGLIGAALYQINLTVPASLAPGTYSVVLTQDGVASPATAMLKIAAN